MASSAGPDDLAALYAAKPAEFTALRTELAAAAKKRGDTEAAGQIAAARKPTTAAWVVNNLVHGDAGVRDRLRDLAGRLREAHAEMDGERIRALSAEQRQLVSGLTREAFTAAGVKDPSAALHDDVTATLQAAIADADVAARLGTLVKAEQWSGFGFGVSTAKAPPAKATKKAPAAKDHQRRRELTEARAAMAEARQAKADTDETLKTRHRELAAARTRHEDAQRRLRAAERELRDAEAAYQDAEQAGLDAAARLDQLRKAAGNRRSPPGPSSSA